MQTLVFSETIDPSLDSSSGKIISEDFKLQFNVLLRQRPEGSEMEGNCQFWLVCSWAGDIVQRPPGQLREEGAHLDSQRFCRSGAVLT